MRGKSHLVLAIGVLLTTCACLAADETVVREDFERKLADGWLWVRENPSAWRVTGHGLEVRSLPGNMWGPPNNAVNVLVRPLPNFTNSTLEIAVTIENRPTEQYEQADLVWYYDDSHMVKLGQELVDGKLSIVMGREEKDRTRTIAIIPLNSFKVRLRLTANGGLLRGEFRLPEDEKWRLAGECDMPAKGEPKASLQTYQGPKAAEHWVKFTEFRVVKHSR